MSTTKATTSFKRKYYIIFKQQQQQQHTNQPLARVTINVLTSLGPKIGVGLSIDEKFHLVIS
jgi:hypothetical protein